MSTTTAAVPQIGTGRDMRRHLRRNEAEDAKKNSVAFDLRIRCQQLEEALRKAQTENRRLSARAPLAMEEFYNFGTPGETPAKTHAPSNYDFNAILPAPHHPRRDSDAASVNAYSESSARPAAHSQTSAPPAAETAFSRQMFEEELSEITRKKDELEEQVTKEILKSSDLEARLDQLKQDALAADERHRQELRYLQSLRDELEQTASVKAGELERQLLIKEDADRRASLAEAKATELAAKYDRTAMQLEAERRRIEEWEKTRRKDVANGQFVNKSGELDVLLKEMDAQRYKLDNAKYSKSWRDDVLKNMDLCLRVLYACEHQVVEKRSLFVQRSCAVTSRNTKHSMASSSSATTS